MLYNAGLSSLTEKWYCKPPGEVMLHSPVAWTVRGKAIHIQGQFKAALLIVYLNSSGLHNGSMWFTDNICRQRIAFKNKTFHAYQHDFHSQWVLGERGKLLTQKELVFYPESWA